MRPGAIEAVVASCSNTRIGSSVDSTVTAVVRAYPFGELNGLQDVADRLRRTTGPRSGGGPPTREGSSHGRHLAMRPIFSSATRPTLTTGHG
jgi:hypothetical protein